MGKQALLNHAVIPPLRKRSSSITNDLSIGVAYVSDDVYMSSKVSPGLTHVENDSDPLAQNKVRLSNSKLPKESQYTLHESLNIDRVFFSSRSQLQDANWEMMHDRTCVVWTYRERICFLALFAQHGKAFDVIASCLYYKTMADVVNFYYRYKHSLCLKELSRHLKVRRRAAGRELIRELARRAKGMDCVCPSFWDVDVVMQRPPAVESDGCVVDTKTLQWILPTHLCRFLPKGSDLDIDVTVGTQNRPSHEDTIANVMLHRLI